MQLGLAGTPEHRHTDTPGPATMTRSAVSCSGRGVLYMVGRNWAVYEEDFWAIDESLTGFLDNSYCRGAALIDRTGQLVTTVGDFPDIDLDSFASLAAADFAANRELAALVGETDFSTLVHQGGEQGLYFQMVSDRVILAALFDRSTTLGLVRFQAKRATRRLEEVLDDLMQKIEGGGMEDVEEIALGAGFADEAEAEFDNLFGE
jgi:predicted regulator of Ras-like GTPase activity (Roadblock/LC7/MglB family)